MMDVRPAIVVAETAFEVLGVGILVLGSLIALVHVALSLMHRQSPTTVYQNLRQDLARAIMLGLEFLVAADIIRSVALEPSFQSVGVLGLIVVVRTFLSWSLEVEMSGEWPWQRASRAAGQATGDTSEL